MEVEVASPAGEMFTRTFVDSPGAVGVVALTRDKEVVLVRQYRTAMEEELLEIPAGMRDVPGEDPLVTAQRELAEEAGIVASEWTHLGRVVSAAGISNAMVELYLARELSEVDIDRHGPEEQHMTVEVVSFESALNMIFRGRITDSKTMVGLMLARQLIEEAE